MCVQRFREGNPMKCRVILSALWNFIPKSHSLNFLSCLCLSQLTSIGLPLHCWCIYMLWSWLDVQYCHLIVISIGAILCSQPHVCSDRKILRRFGLHHQSSLRDVFWDSMKCKTEWIKIDLNWLHTYKEPQCRAWKIPSANILNCPEFPKNICPVL